MAVPRTPADLLELIRKSELIDAERLRTYVDNVRRGPNSPNSAGRLAKRMIDDGWLTRLQVSLLLQGKWKRFIILGRYKLLEHIGNGGMGQVFLCEHLRMARRVALKILPNERAKDDTAIQRFYREARASAALDHPNIVAAHDIDSDGDMHFLVMEYVDGSNLQEVVKQSGPMPIGRAVEYTIQAACGLQHAHDAGLVHRDVKPSNLLLDRGGQVKLLDLGLAKFFEDSTDQITQRIGGRSLLGTADYLAPEQARDSHFADARSDIYSLGATLYFLLAGHTPFRSKTIALKLLQHQNEKAQPLREIRPELPQELADIVDRAMAKDPNERFQDCLQLIDALNPFAPTLIDVPDTEEMPKLCPAARTNESPSIRIPAPERSGARMTRPPLDIIADFADPPTYLGWKHVLYAAAICSGGLVFGVVIGSLASRNTAQEIVADAPTDAGKEK